MSIYKFFNNISRNKKIDIYNYGNHSRSFTYVSDIVENIDKLIIQTNKRNKNFNEIINIGNPKSIPLMNVIKLIEKKLSREQLFQAKEVFLTSASSFIIPIIQIDNHKINQGVVGNVSLDLRKSYFDNFKYS